ncbi:hypothetical protein [Actinomycetospora sp. NBRC 106375]|uniref:hypothetical protein n=1 Tax=Actinomycetospora sp. NBRC 106375 TaxID=3032207 RepID=UPI002556FA02|nr:hypothetical protein [Actinomycetospora sp. NBRC 106375]
MDRWTMVLEAVPGSLAAIRVDDDEYRRVEAELKDGYATALSAALTTVVEVEGSDPEHLVLVVPGDLESGRFADLTEAVNLAGLPDPSWLPDAVAWAGPQLAVREAGTAVIVLDARRDQVAAWSVRTADDGVEIGRDGPIDLTSRLDALLSGVVYSKLAVVAPEIADALRERADAAGRRDAAHLARELREARHIMCTTDGEELIVTAGEAEVYLTRDEFTGLVEHALRDTVTLILGAEEASADTILVAGCATPIVEHLAGITGATVLPAPVGKSSLDGAAALVLPRPVHGEEPVADAADDPDPTDGVPFLATALPPPTGSDIVRVPYQPAAYHGPPRWAVPALSTLLVLSLAGAGAVLVTHPSPESAATDAGAVSPDVPVVPVGLDLPADPGR